MKSFLKVFRLVIAFIFVWPIFPMAFIGLIFYYLFYLVSLLVSFSKLGKSGKDHKSMHLYQGHNYVHKYNEYKRFL